MGRILVIIWQLLHWLNGYVTSGIPTVINNGKNEESKMAAKCHKKCTKLIFN